MKPAVAVLSSLCISLAGAAALAQEGTPAGPVVTLKMPDGGSYTGTVTGGVPDGRGYFQDANGMQYEGEVRMGQRTGIGEGLYPKGDDYQGEWKDGKPDGVGKMVYALGGAYDGEWKNGKRHGKGTMTFSGSGRQAPVRFENGKRVDAELEKPTAATTSARFAISSDRAPTGSNLRARIAYGSLPLDKGFDELTPDQQRFVRSYYPALDVGDDPPYPLHGGKELYAALSTLAGRLQLREDLLIYVEVGADAKVSKVTAMGKLDPEIKRAIAVAAGQLKYTPGRCAGQPCGGIVPFNLKLTVAP